MSRIVKQSLSYYRTGTVPQKADLAAIVEESLQIFSGKFHSAGIQVTKKITAVASVLGFPDEIRQVIDNLLLNAIEAKPNRLANNVRRRHASAMSSKMLSKMNWKMKYMRDSSLLEKQTTATYRKC